MTVLLCETSAPPLLAPAAVAARLRRADAGEWAFIDLREAGEAAEGHPFASTNLPYSRLELDLPEKVPNANTPLVLIDGGDGVALRAARRIAALGRREIALVEGGVPGWAASGLPLIEGVHTWSKAFGEWARRRFDTPAIGAEDLAAVLAGPEPPVLIDTRPAAEYRAFTIPGARNCPNAELALRLPEMAPARKRVVLHCAGRTRSIIGAQTVRDFDLPNDVVALHDGTQGWELAGFTREFGADRTPPDGLTADGLAEAGRRARAVMARNRIPFVLAAQVTDWLRRGVGTVYRFDPRPESEAMPPAGFRSAPGTTLIQQTDQFIAVRGARVVLWDPLLVRAVFAALWLRRMGHAAFVLSEAPPAADPTPLARQLPPCPPAVSAPRLAGHMAAGGIVIDMRPWSEWRQARLAGVPRAFRAVIDRLPLPAGARVVVLATDPDLAAIAGVDLEEAGCVVTGFCAAGPDAWTAANLAVETGPPSTGDAPDEVRFCAGRHSGNLEHARAYLDWEGSLLDRLEAAGLLPWPATGNERKGEPR